MILVVSAFSVVFVVPSNTFAFLYSIHHSYNLVYSCKTVLRLTVKISSGRFIIYVEGWGGGERGEGAGQYSDCSVFLSEQFLDPPPLIKPGDCQTKTRHSNLNI